MELKNPSFCGFRRSLIHPIHLIHKERKKKQKRKKGLLLSFLLFVALVITIHARDFTLKRNGVTQFKYIYVYIYV